MRAALRLQLRFLVSALVLLAPRGAQLSSASGHRYGERLFLLEYYSRLSKHYVDHERERRDREEWRQGYHRFLSGALPRLRGALADARKHGLPLAELDLRWPVSRADESQLTIVQTQWPYSPGHLGSPATRPRPSGRHRSRWLS